MARVRTSVSIDTELLTQARSLSVDVSEAAEAGLRRAVDEAREDHLRDWLERHKEAFRVKAERDRAEGLANESLRAF